LVDFSRMPAATAEVFAAPLELPYRAGADWLEKSQRTDYVISDLQQT
jgi:hypothetical protein